MSSEEGNTQIYIAKLGPKVNEKDLEYEFRNYGKIKNILLKQGYAFIEYESYTEAKEAVKAMDGNVIEGSRIVVQHASI